MSDAELICTFILPARNWVERGRSGAVVDAVPVFQRVWHRTSALIGEGYSAKLALSNERLAQLRSRFCAVESRWRAEFGHGFDGGFIESAARFLLEPCGSPTPDAIRDRVLEARVQDGWGVGIDDGPIAGLPLFSRKAPEPKGGIITTQQIGDRWAVVRNQGTGNEQHLGHFDTERDANEAAERQHVVAKRATGTEGPEGR